MNKNVYVYIFWLSVSICVNGSNCILCYNCSASHRDWSQHCGSTFVRNAKGPFNDTKFFLVNCSENSMCFVRSWSARAQHSWLVQRGCYQPPMDDPLPAMLNLPTRAMTCKHERLPDAEYKVCLCQSDWCNSASKLAPFYLSLITSKYVLMFILFCITFI